MRREFGIRTPIEFCPIKFPNVRKEAIRGIGILGKAEDLGNVMNLLINPAEDADRTDGKSAIVYTFFEEYKKIKLN